MLSDPASLHYNTIVYSRAGAFSAGKQQEALPGSQSVSSLSRTEQSTLSEMCMLFKSLCFHVKERPPSVAV